VLDLDVWMVLVQRLCCSLSHCHIFSSSILQERVLLVFWFSIEMKMVLVVLATLLCCVLCGVFRMSVNTTCSCKCLLARLRLSACMKCVEQEGCTHRDRYG